MTDTRNFTLSELKLRSRAIRQELAGMDARRSTLEELLSRVDAFIFIKGMDEEGYELVEDWRTLEPGEENVHVVVIRPEPDVCFILQYGTVYTFIGGLGRSVQGGGSSFLLVDAHNEIMTPPEEIQVYVWKSKGPNPTPKKKQ